MKNSDMLRTECFWVFLVSFVLFVVGNNMNGLRSCLCVSIAEREPGDKLPFFPNRRKISKCA